MYTTTRRIVSMIAAVILLITCTIAGLVLPAATEDPIDVVQSEPTAEDNEGLSA